MSVFSLDIKAGTGVGTAGAQFLKIGPGARVDGIGSAFCAIADDVTAVYWNPAGIGQLEGFVAYSRKIKMNSENKKLFLGINAKYIHQRIHHESAKGIGIDIGTLYHTGWENFRIGITFSNFGPDMHFTGPGLQTDVNIVGSVPGSRNQPTATTAKRSAELDTLAFSLPASFRFGIAFDAIKSSKEVLTFAIDSHHPSDNTERMHLGAEYVYKDSGSIRAGYKLRLRSRKDENGKSVSLAVEDQEGVSLGLGYKTRLNDTEMNFDYAFTNFGRLQQTHRVTLGLSF